MSAARSGRRLRDYSAYTFHNENPSEEVLEGGEMLKRERSQQRDGPLAGTKADLLTESSVS